jgi:hypothetical protein
MKTKYFTCVAGNGLKASLLIWRYKGGKMEYFTKSFWRGNRWHISNCTVDGGKQNHDNWQQISRDKARKIEPAAFK